MIPAIRAMPVTASESQSRDFLVTVSETTNGVASLPTLKQSHCDRTAALPNNPFQILGYDYVSFSASTEATAFKHGKPNPSVQLPVPAIN